MIAATSATVRNRTALSGVASAAIDSPLRRFPLRQAISSAPVTPVSSVIGTRKRATPSGGVIWPAAFVAAANLWSYLQMYWLVHHSSWLTSAEFPPSVPSGLYGGQESRSDAVPLQFPYRADRSPAWRRHRLAQNHRMLTRFPQHRSRTENGLLDHLQGRCS